MQVQGSIELLRLMRKYHMIETPRAKLALMVIGDVKKNPTKRDSSRCATCIFNLHRGPYDMLDVMIYSEL